MPRRFPKSRKFKDRKYGLLHGRFARILDKASSEAESLGFCVSERWHQGVRLNEVTVKMTGRMDDIRAFVEFDKTYCSGIDSVPVWALGELPCVSKGSVKEEDIIGAVNEMCSLVLVFRQRVKYLAEKYADSVKRVCADVRDACSRNNLLVTDSSVKRVAEYLLRVSGHNKSLRGEIAKKKEE